MGSNGLRPGHPRRFAVIASALLAALLGACSSTPAAHRAPVTVPPSSTTAPRPVSDVDYSQASTWLSTPTALTHPVDVFYLSDTAYSKPDATSPDIGPIDAPSMISGDQAAFERTATAFAPVANIYAPYYRQVDTKVQSSMTPAEQVAMVGSIPTSDAIAAFQYYLDHFNDGRPFILAGHSQGSSVLTHLLADYMGTHPDVYRRMVAAYVIGYPVTPQYLADNPHLRFAEGPTDTGVIISYNTEAPTLGVTNPVMLGVTDALVINPITWTRTETPATAAENLGSWLPASTNGPSTKTEAFADATINLARGVIICDSPDAQPLATEGIMHSYDYPFYYFDIQANAAARVERFMTR